GAGRARGARVPGRARTRRRDRLLLPAAARDDRVLVRAGRHVRRVVRRHLPGRALAGRHLPELAATRAHRRRAGRVRGHRTRAGAPEPGAVLGPMPTTGAGPAERDLAAMFESCKLLTRGDLEHAFGQPYRDAEPTLDENSSVISSVTKDNRGCTYWATERRAGGVGEVDIDVAHLPDAAATYATIRDRYVSVPTFTDVPGVGDGAFRSGGMLMVRKGD